MKLKNLYIFGFIWMLFCGSYYFKRTNNRDRELYLTCVHEAGHFYGSRYFGIKCLRIEIKNTLDLKGQSFFEPICDPFANCIISAIGDFCEMKDSCQNCLTFEIYGTDRIAVDSLRKVDTTITLEKMILTLDFIYTKEKKNIYSLADSLYIYREINFN